MGNALDIYVPYSQNLKEGVNWPPHTKTVIRSLFLKTIKDRN